MCRVICNADAGYSSLVVKHSAAPFKVLGQQGGDVAGLNCKLSAAVMGMMKQAGKTVTVFLPGSDGDIIKYLLRLKGECFCLELSLAVSFFLSLPLAVSSCLSLPLVVSHCL